MPCTFSQFLKCALRAVLFFPRLPFWLPQQRGWWPVNGGLCAAGDLWPQGTFGEFCPGSGCRVVCAMELLQQGLFTQIPADVGQLTEGCCVWGSLLTYMPSLSTFCMIHSVAWEESKGE